MQKYRAHPPMSVGAISFCSKILILVFLQGSIHTSIYSQYVYYPGKGEWQQKEPAELDVDALKLEEAVDFARANEYSGDRDLRIAILGSFVNTVVRLVRHPVWYE